MSVHTRADMPQASFDAAERINITAGHCQLGASEKLISFVRPFVAIREGSFTFRQVVLSIWRKELLGGVSEDDITCDTSIRRALDAMRKAGKIEKVGDGPRGQLWKRTESFDKEQAHGNRQPPGNLVRCVRDR